MRSFVPPIIILSAFLFSACAQTPPRLRGEFVPIEPAQASTGKFNGTPVRWGGIVTGMRAVDAGSCIEVSAFPLDKWTSRPINLDTSAYTHGDSVRPMYYTQSGKFDSPPRFLACGADTQDKSIYHVGAVVTAVGTLAEPLVFEAEFTSCLENLPQRHGQPDYAGSIHVAKDRLCAVSLPILRIAQAYAWAEPPSRNGFFNENAHN
ncbi:MAG: Slp family lipoprotein [Proteobacteria bacterium]|uniref:Slp family lipoprotein n=1 Tax=Rudaea sp. TaxID=2136325 RepID=UPI0037833368|nr:Slp family lipoprotein [Pseudomonadota bacterium]